MHELSVPKSTSWNSENHPPQALNGAGFRQAEAADLERVNNLIASAMATWKLSDRIRRISLPLYRYDLSDLEHLHIIIAEDDSLGIVGVAAIEAADAAECPGKPGSALLHGLYVDPRQHRFGLGSSLLEYMKSVAAARNFGGLLVKAQREAASFFEARGFEKLAIEEPSRDYPHRYWISL